jgi:hypothetical protein
MKPLRRPATPAGPYKPSREPARVTALAKPEPKPEPEPKKTEPALASAPRPTSRFVVIIALIGMLIGLIFAIPYVANQRPDQPAASGQGVRR